MTQVNPEDGGIRAGTQDGAQEGTPASETVKRRARFVPLMVALIVVIGAVDQVVKHIMLNWLTPGEPVAVIGDWFRFQLLFNPGAAFSMGTGFTWIFTCIQIVFLVGILIYSPKVGHPWIAVGLAMVAGGALGNGIDRLFREPAFFVGHVVDYVSVGSFAVFNIADASITCGVVVFIIGMLLEDRAAARAKAAHE